MQELWHTPNTDPTLWATFERLWMTENFRDNVFCGAVDLLALDLENKTLQYIHLPIQMTSHFLEEPCNLTLPPVIHCYWCASNQQTWTPAAIDSAESFPITVKLSRAVKRALEKRIFTAVLRAIGSVKLGTRGTWTPVHSCPKCSLPAPPLD